jgi:DNA primase catalytic subunit
MKKLVIISISLLLSNIVIAQNDTIKRIAKSLILTNKSKVKLSEQDQKNLQKDLEKMANDNQKANDIIKVADIEAEKAKKAFKTYDSIQKLNKVILTPVNLDSVKKLKKQVNNLVDSYNKTLEKENRIMKDLERQNSKKTNFDNILDFAKENIIIVGFFIFLILGGLYKFLFKRNN